MIRSIKTILVISLFLLVSNTIHSKNSDGEIFKIANSYLKKSNYFKGKLTRNLDSMAYYAHKVVELSESRDFLEELKIDAICNLALKEIFLNELDKARDYLEVAISDSHKIEYGLGLSVAYRRAAFVYKAEKDFNLHIYNLEKSYQYAKDYTLPQPIIFDAALDLSIAYIEFQYGTDQISQVLLEVIDLIDDPEISLKSKGVFYQNLGAVYELNKANEEAIEAYKKALDLFKKDNNTLYQYYPLVNLSNIYRILKKIPEAIAVLESALALNIEVTKANIYYSLGLIYLDKEDYINAENYLKKSLVAHEGTDKYERQGDCLRLLGKIKNELDDDEQSKIFLNRASTMYKKSLKENKKRHINQSKIAKSYLGLYEVNLLNNNYKKSLENYKLYTVYQDSIDSARTLNVSERFAFFKEMTQKDKEIEVLQNQNEIQNLTAKRQNYFKMSLLFFLALILLLFAVLLNRYRLKKKALKIIKEKNEENKLLMREIHHRVKNNLQIISSLLGSQIYKHNHNDELKEILLESQNQIKSMAIIHQNLFNDKKFSRVSVRSYIVELTEHIQSSFGKNGQSSTKVQINLDVDANHIQIGLAIPLGLILNELLTNCYKYAFAGVERRVNTIDIKFQQIENSSKYYLSVKDNGIGLPFNFDISNLTSYGIQLVQGLVNQLNGEIEITGDEGTHYNIVLEEPIQDTFQSAS